MFVCQPIFQILYRYILAQLLLLRTKSLGRVLSTTRCHQPGMSSLDAGTGHRVLCPTDIEQAGKDYHGYKWYSPIATKSTPTFNVDIWGQSGPCALGEIESLFCLGEKITPSNVLTQSAISILRTSDILYTFMHVIFITGKLPFYKSHYWNRSPCI